MYLLLSGEGASDIGICNPSSGHCDRQTFQEGPMAIIVDQLVEAYQGYDLSHLVTERVSYVSETYLAANKQPPMRKAMALKGKKKPAETQYYFENARVLAAVARAKSEDVQDKVVAVLFRDSDGTASADRGIWQDKRNSMIEGFKAAAYELGVAMIPKPKSEAWLLCATKENAYQHCATLEDESGNDHAVNPLKGQLYTSLNGNSGSGDLNQLLRDKVIDITQIDMPSFNTFKEDLRIAVALANEACS